MDFPGGASGKEHSCKCRRPRFDPWVWKILPGEFHGQRSLVGYSPKGRKESDMIE